MIYQITKHWSKNTEQAYSVEKIGEGKELVNNSYSITL